MIPEIATVLGITVICYLIGLGVKISPLDDKYIPLIVGVCGGALGALGMATMTDYPASNFSGRHCLRPRGNRHRSGVQAAEGDQHIPGKTRPGERRFCR